MPIDALITTACDPIPFRYTSAKGDVSQRTVIPVALTPLLDGTVGLRGFCTLREQRRTFSLNRMRAADEASFWEHHNTWLQAPYARIQAVQHFQYRAQYHPPSNPYWAELLGAQTGLAWRDVDGTIRMDPAADWGHEPDAPPSHHAVLAHRRARNEGAARLLAACPPNTTHALVFNNQAGYQDPSGQWQFLP